MSKLTYVKGDLFSAPDGSILVHSCNTLGSWGAGIALTFRETYPAQFEEYEAHCKSYGTELIGTCMSIPGEKHDIACLFTSKAYGRRKDKPEEILDATKEAIQDLMKQNQTGKALHACRFNSGKFAVAWTDTEAILKDLGVEMVVYEPVEVSA
ncbi:ADP-ribose 1''-phosphate phosphatase [Crucibulum laeve]|uniref:ADP-ribose 1''-phosphate phosphatase n=1 Tax=Crucibulum laeve TaxID=68775 RepID=A0A5C3M7S4_9AGAR|nr:ADP-ribose 1''-phosphate phosphatase [Crucibulum laeve]